MKTIGFSYPVSKPAGRSGIRKAWDSQKFVASYDVPAVETLTVVNFDVISASAGRYEEGAGCAPEGNALPAAWGEPGWRTASRPSHEGERGSFGLSMNGKAAEPRGLEDGIFHPLHPFR